MTVSKKKRKIFYILTAILTLLAVGAVFAYTLFFSPAIVSGNGNETVVYIKTHDDYNAVFTQLKEKGILRYPMGFEIISSVSEYKEKVKPGKYSFTSEMSNYDIVKLLGSGRQEEIKLVLKSHWQLNDLLKYVNAKLNIDSVKLMQVLSDTTALKGLGMNDKQLMLYFVPNTYNFYWNVDPLFFVSRISKAYNDFWTDERKSKASKIGLTKEEVGVLASIIDKETAKVDEMPMIAGVYMNRLHSGDKKLRADATIIFAHNGFGTIKRVREGHIERTKDSPYNTYYHDGLPPGPICVPSAQAVDAVLNYRKHDYIFYCAKEDFSGYHNFAVTLDEHNLNAKRFRMEQDRRGIK